MSKEFKKKWLASRIKANKGRLSRLGSYQSSKYKPIVLTIDGQKVELDRTEYGQYVEKIRSEKIEHRKSISRSGKTIATNDESVTESTRSIEDLKEQFAHLGKILQEKIKRSNEPDQE